MRNVFSWVVNLFAALFAAELGAPHPVVGTDETRDAKSESETEDAADAVHDGEAAAERRL